MFFILDLFLCLLFGERICRLIGIKLINDKLFEITEVFPNP